MHFTQALRRFAQTFFVRRAYVVSMKHLAFLLSVPLLVSSTYAAAWIRWNQAGYAPDRAKVAVVLADTDLQGSAWTLTDGNGATVLSGSLAAGKAGDDVQVAQAFWHTVDFSALKNTGTYSLAVPGAATASIKVLDDPYSVLATQALMHLRAMRSGTSATRLHGASHLGDSVAVVKIPDNLALGSWKAASPARTVDMRGGHYDAGDFIKFTLNEAYLAWQLLTAYRESPAVFARVQSTSALPDVLDEARHSLEYLEKTFPDANTFVIQVGDGSDHQQGWRMPENDALNGKRPALCALSRVHMGSAAAALALGAAVFQSLDSEAAARWQAKAIAIYARARQSDAVSSAFERNATNDFYHDATDADNMALAAAELYALTGKADYLTQGSAYAPPAATEVSWGDWNSFANIRLAMAGDAAARTRALTETERYTAENAWQVPDHFTWGTLHRWIGMANAHLRTQRYLQNPAQESALFQGVLDYTFGRNPWGIPMMASGDLPNSIRNVYNGIYRLTEAFPTGALSEGPGDKATHVSMREYFAVPANSPTEPFNSSAAVFYDNADDFMIQESTIGGQGDLLLMLALASSANIVARSDSGTIPTSLYKAPDSEQAFAATRLPWYSYDDRAEGGNSVAGAVSIKTPSISVNLDTRSNDVLGYGYSGLQGPVPSGANVAQAHGVRLVMDIPKGQVLRVNMVTADISDYGYHGKEILGKGPGSYWIDFSKIAQAFGTPVGFNASQLEAIDITNNTVGQVSALRIDSVVFYHYNDQPDYTPMLPVAPSHRGPASLFLARYGDLLEFTPAANCAAESLAIFDVAGNLLTRLYRDARQKFVWNVQRVPAGIYLAKPSDGSNALRLKR